MEILRRSHAPLFIHHKDCMQGLRCAMWANLMSVRISAYHSVFLLWNNGKHIIVFFSKMLIRYTTAIAVSKINTLISYHTTPRAGEKLGCLKCKCNHRASFNFVQNLQLMSRVRKFRSICRALEHLVNPMSYPYCWVYLHQFTRTYQHSWYFCYLNFHQYSQCFNISF